jgi:hypothetical protein
VRCSHDVCCSQAVAAMFNTICLLGAATAYACACAGRSAQGLAVQQGTGLDT